VKRSILSILLLLALFFILAETFAAAEKEDPKPTSKSTVAKSPARRPRRDRWDANSLTADLKFLADPKAIKSKLDEFEGLKKALADINKKSQKETREWTSALGLEDNIEGRRDLAKAAQGQAIAELVFVRELALEEGAVKTAAAIEGLLLDKQERLGKVLKKLEATMRKLQRSGRRSRRDRGFNRGMRGSYLEREGQQDIYRDQGMYRDRRYRNSEERRREPEDRRNGR